VASPVLAGGPHTLIERLGLVAHLIKRLARRVFLSDPAQVANDVVDHYRQMGALQHWERTGRVLPPPHLVKQWTVLQYAGEFGLETLIETGTYLGAMIRATRGSFRRIYSVELDRALYHRAERKFARDDHITLYRGDSAEVLPSLLERLDEPCLFWLDAHHSGALTARGELESPVMQEIQCILRHPVCGHVVLVDDARAFVGEGGYPTLAGLQATIAARRPDWAFQVQYDIIRMHKSRGAAPCRLPAGGV
jgi:hypothetical protein